jgi:6-phosphogluconolactonase
MDQRDVMRNHQQKSVRRFVFGWALAAGWCAVPSVALEAVADARFALYAPSAAEQRLLVVRALPTGNDVTLEMACTVNLAFPGSRITTHATEPLLYVSGGRGQNGHNAAIIPLDETGLPRKPRPVTLDRSYSYLSTDRAGRFLLGCDYVSGAVDVYPLDAAGFPGKRVTGLDEGRKNAHCVFPSPDNRFLYIPYVKETNALFQYAFDPATGGLAPLKPKDARPPADSGPRHLVYHPRLPLVYFSEEQGLGVSVYNRDDDGRLTLAQRARAVPDDAPASGVSASDIVITPDGRHLYAGIRGHAHDFDFIACYAVGDDGNLVPRGRVATDKIPWGMALSPDGRFLAVTGFDSATLVLYSIAGDGGLARAATLPWDRQISSVIAR